MKTKIKLLSLVLGIALSGILFTQCVKNEESDGVRAVREGYAELLKGNADYLKAQAEHERALAEYVRLQAQWEKAEADANTELLKLDAKLKELEVKLKELELKMAEDLYDLELQVEKSELEAELARLEAMKQGYLNDLLQAQHEYAKALIDNEAALIVAKQLLAQAEADALKDDPKFAAYQDLYNQLFVSPDHYGDRTDLMKEKLDKQSEIITFKYSVDADRLAWLKRDSVKAEEKLKYTKELLGKYESLNGLSVAELQGKADDAKIDWTQATVTVAEKAAGTLTAQNKYNEESTKWSNEYTKLTNLRYKLTSSVSLVVLDSLYSLNYYNYPANYPASVSELVNSVYSTTLSGYKNIYSRATGRLAYLKSQDITATQATGFGYSSTPQWGEPTKKWLEEEIKYIEDVKVPAIDLQIAEETAKVAEANTKLNAGKTAWASAESAYKSQVAAVNSAAAALRTQLTTWKKAAQDSVSKPALPASSLTVSQQSAYFNVIKNYYVARYNFDRFLATGTVQSTYQVPTNIDSLTAANTTFTAQAFFTTANFGLASNWSSQVTLITALEQVSDIKIVNNYEWFAIDGSTPKGTVTAPDATGAIVLPTWPSATSTVATHYVNGGLGTLLYQSRTVYGASTLDDIHYFLPYDTKRPTGTINAKTPVFGNYTTSLFADWYTKNEALTTLKNNKTYTFYIENYRTVLALVNRTITYYEGLETEYGALIAETEAAVAAQEKVVNEQAKVREAANIALQEAQAIYNTAATHANNLKNLYDLLSNTTSSTLAIIKDIIEDLENEIDGLIDDVVDANKDLAEYIAQGGSGEVVADKIAELEAQIKDIDAQIAVLDLIIKEIEAKMAALLQ